MGGRLISEWIKDGSVAQKERGTELAKKTIRPKLKLSIMRQGKILRSGSARFARSAAGIDDNVGGRNGFEYGKQTTKLGSGQAQDAGRANKVADAGSDRQSGLPRGGACASVIDAILGLTGLTDC